MLRIGDGSVRDTLVELFPGALPGTEELLASLSDLDLDVQLPLYLHLLAAQGECSPVNAAWVELGKSGAERALFAEDIDVDERRAVIEARAPALLRFALLHMLAAPELSARPGRLNPASRTNKPPTIQAWRRQAP